MPAGIVDANTVDVMTDAASAGDSIRRRRHALGMTVKALAEQAGVDRGRLAAIEDGASARGSTIGAIEATLSRLEEEMGGPYEEPPSSGLVEFDVSGEGGFHIVVKGPVDDAEVIKRQVVDIILAMRKAENDTPKGE